MSTRRPGRCSPASPARVFREASGVDEATWARARAWVMIPALTGLPYYRETFPAFAETSRYRLSQVLADV